MATASGFHSFVGFGAGRFCAVAIRFDPRQRVRSADAPRRGRPLNELFSSDAPRGCPARVIFFCGGASRCLGIPLFQFILLEADTARGIPIWGICKGLQCTGRHKREQLFAVTKNIFFKNPDSRLDWQPTSGLPQSASGTIELPCWDGACQPRSSPEFRRSLSRRGDIN